MAIDVDPNDLIMRKSYRVQGRLHDARTKLRERAPVLRCETDA